ncbi:MAG: FKBP-type peptidyl-prolyl cis-trans isomerase FklB [Crocinitomix sp.]|jgi:FKBP-type peptidyl-prolyl cis-trans isomerase FklB
MRTSFLYFFLALFFFACNGEKEVDIDVEPVQKPKHVFTSFESKISYCIGFDNGFTITQVYNDPKISDKFFISDIEEGLVAYLGDGELRVGIFEVDAVLELYLAENGEVDESQVSKADASYAIGLIEAQDLVSSLVGRGIDQTMDIEFLIKGIQDGMYNQQNTLGLAEIRTEVAKYYGEMNLVMGQSFLAENLKNETVSSTESGLQYEIIKSGTGISPNLTDTCVVHYTGRTIDGRVFESTVPSSIPAEFSPLGVIPGWKEGLLLMKEGGSWRFFIPHDLAYGETGSGPIEPFSTLVFDLDLIEVKRFNPE